MEVSWGFLRRSLKETLAFNCLRSVGEEEETVVVGTYWIPFLLSSFCLSFVFLSCFPLSLFLYLPLIFARWLLYFVGMLMPRSLNFFCCVWLTLLREAPYRGWWIYLWWRAPGQGLSVAWEGFCRHVSRASWVFGGGLPGLLAGVGAFSFGGFTCSVCRVTEFLFPSGWWLVLYLCRGCRGGRPYMN